MRLTERYNRFAKTIYPAKTQSLALALSVGAGIKYFPEKCPNWMLNVNNYNLGLNRSALDWSLSKVTDFHGFLSNNILTRSIYGLIFGIGKKVSEPVFGVLKSIASMVGIEDKDSWINCTAVFVAWFAYTLFTRYSLKRILSYEKFIWENKRDGFSLRTKLWFMLLKVFRGKPQLYHCQAALPHLPLPSIKDTVRRWLDSVKPCTSDAEFEECQNLAREFERGLGPTLNRYLMLKTWLTTNYVTDWWEDYVYLKGRGPIMVKSNYYGIGRIGYNNSITVSTKQDAVAGNLVHALLKWRYDLDRENFEPQSMQGVRPICMSQYRRLFNTTRIPVTAASDEIVHFPSESSSHIAVIHNGKYWKLDCYDKFNRALTPAELQDQFKIILSDKSEPQPGEDKLAACTAASRDKWHHVRKTHFLSRPVNAETINCIESAAFVVCLRGKKFDMDENNKNGGLSEVAKDLLHGDNGTDIWFDKSFNWVIYEDGFWGFNAEHAFADAPVLGMTLEKAIVGDCKLSYDAAGNCMGKRIAPFQVPKRLTMQLTKEAIADIEESVTEATELCEDTDMCLYKFNEFGKTELTKKLKTSPDAFIQTALQLAHFTDKNKFVQTYESAMTRMYRNGRTETIRSCTEENTDFVKALVANMNGPEGDNKTSKKDLRKLYDLGVEKHGELSRNALLGQGVDRHLFCLYVVSYGLLGIKSSFLEKALGFKWGLSTSQTPAFQWDVARQLFDSTKALSPGGGFGPVDSDGYGVSYIICSDTEIFFHVSSCKSADSTDSKRFVQRIHDAMMTLKEAIE